MKESVLDILIYLYDNCVSEEFESIQDRNNVKTHLIQAGFTNYQVNRAFDWLECLLKEHKYEVDLNVSCFNSTRIFNSLENEKIDVECKGFLLFLEQSNIINLKDRELIVDLLMALEIDAIKIHQLKWVVLMVLTNQPDREIEFSWIEEILMDNTDVSIH